MGLEPVPAVLGWEVGYSLDMSQVYWRGWIKFLKKQSVWKTTQQTSAFAKDKTVLIILNADLGENTVSPKFNL